MDPRAPMSLDPSSKGIEKVALVSMVGVTGFEPATPTSRIPDERVGIFEDVGAATGWHFFHANHQRSVLYTTRQSVSGVHASYHYGAYGESQDSPTGNPIRYTGRYFDAETGLYYYRARFYSPRLGRFLQTDPIGIKDDINLYAYTHNDPVGLVDPQGEGAKYIGFAKDPTGLWEAARDTERRLYAVAARTNSSGVNIAFAHGDMQGLWVNFQFGPGQAINSTPVSNALKRDPAFNSQQTTILTACLAGQTMTGSYMARELGTPVIAGLGYVAHGSDGAGGTKLTVNKELNSGKGDSTFVEFSADGQRTGREFSSITIRADGSVSMTSTKAVTPTGSRIARKVTIECTAQGKCK